MIATVRAIRDDDAAHLAQAMAQQHWQLLQTWRYSCAPTPQLLLLFQKLH